VFLAALQRKVPVNDDDLIPANLPRQALRNEFFALLTVGRQPGSGPETGFSEVPQIGTDKSASGYRFLGLFLTTAHPAPGRCDH
jgi:hypothetical protein